MDVKQILELMDRFSDSALSELEVELAGGRVRMAKGGAPVAAPAPLAVPAAQAAPPPPAADIPEAPATQAGVTINAPMVGTFYLCPGPGEPPFAPVGSAVKKGQTVCVLEAMKMMNEVPAPFDCVIEQVLLTDGELAGYDAPLFRVRES